MGGTSVADLPGQQSVGGPVLETELHESEAELSGTSLTGETQLATITANSHLNIWHLRMPTLY